MPAGVHKRFSDRYQFQVSYTLGKTMDNMQARLNADVNNSSVYPPDPYDRDAEWARADFDVRHVFTAGPNEAPLATAGRITRTITSSRQLQLGGKLLF